MLEVAELTDAYFGMWDEYVFTSPDSSFFHRAGWKTVIEKGLGHRTHFLYATRAGKIVAILPLVEIKSLLFGHSLASMSFCESGGILASDPEAMSVLLAAACELAKKLKVDALELRNRQLSESGWPIKDLYVTFRREMDPDPEVNMKAIPRKQRAMVRKGIKLGLVSHLSDDWNRVYRIYSESVRNLGTPVFPSKLFHSLKTVFGDDCKMLIVSHEGDDIAAVMSFYFKDQVLPYFGGSLPIARQLKGNDFMYWELMRISCESGIRFFDFGRSKVGTGSYSFKKNWGFEPLPLYYEYFLVSADHVPDVNPMNPKYQTFIKLWKKLPLPVANTVGPWFSRNLG